MTGPIPIPKFQDVNLDPVVTESLFLESFPNPVKLSPNQAQVQSQVSDYFAHPYSQSNPPSKFENFDFVRIG